MAMPEGSAKPVVPAVINAESSKKTSVQPPQTSHWQACHWQYPMAWLASPTNPPISGRFHALHPAQAATGTAKARWLRRHLERCNSATCTRVSPSIARGTTSMTAVQATHRWAPTPVRWAEAVRTGRLFTQVRPYPTLFTRRQVAERAATTLGSRAPPPMDDGLTVRAFNGAAHAP
jgi:hypothetical protein